MQHGMLATSNVQINGHPVLVCRFREGLVVVFRVREAEVIPAAAGPLGHCVGLTCVPDSVLLKVAPFEVSGEAPGWVIAWSEVVHFRKSQGQLVLAHSNGGIIVDFMRVYLGIQVRLALILKFDGEVNRNGFTPVSLTTEDPVTKLVLDLFSAQILLRQLSSDSLFGFLTGKAIKFFTRINGDTILRQGLFFIQFALTWRHDKFLLKAKDIGKVPVPRIVCWDSHHRTATVRTKHVVANINRNLFARQGMLGVIPRKGASLFSLTAFLCTIHITFVDARFHVSLHFIADL
mmetsp:Transcript_5259/g.7699  ORF Transcript_5259/g.7699 Transcript_5259/m.7699 type:complete len:290 (-) Transcript_5259:139-1008(-)